MRTTVSIDDAVYRRAKSRAAESGQSVGSLIEDALRGLLDKTSQETEPLEPLTVFKGTGAAPGIDIDDIASLWAIMDEGRSLDALR
jgi:Ribbon-helix-helix protein, copG family